MKLWHNYHDLLNKEDGSNSWQRPGEWQLDMIACIDIWTITEPNERRRQCRWPGCSGGSPLPSIVILINSTFHSIITANSWRVEQIWQKKNKMFIWWEKVHLQTVEDISADRWNPHSVLVNIIHCTAVFLGCWADGVVISLLNLFLKRG